MAKLSGLVDGMSRLTGFQHGTIGLAARKLREAGLIRSGGRGPGSADMTYTDAANLLLGVAGASQVTEVVDVVRFTREATPWVARFDESLDEGRTGWLQDVVDLPGLKPGATFGDALDTVLQHLGEHEDVFDAYHNSVAVSMEAKRTTHDLNYSAALGVEHGPGDRERFYYHRNSPESDGLKDSERDARVVQLIQRRGFHGVSITCHIDPIVIHGLADLIAGRKEVEEL